MKELIKWFSDDEKRTYFLGGGVGGIAPGIGFLLDAGSSHLIIITYVLKLLAAVVMAFSCGIAAALAADVYKKSSAFVKKRLEKKNNKAA